MSLTEETVHVVDEDLDDQEVASYEAFGSMALPDEGIISKTELRILRSQYPIDVDKEEVEEITVNGESGVLINRAEVDEWQGEYDISEYPIHEDDNPLIISKPTEPDVEYIQELCIRYLRPPTPEPPGDLIIDQAPDIIPESAPPLIIRQQPVRPETPEPLVIREAPPKPPAKLEQIIITIPGKRLPPPPRKVVIERLPSIPAKPQNVIIERWLPYAPAKRQVRFNPALEVLNPVAQVNNVIIQWEEPNVKVSQEIKYLDTIKADPKEYLSRYGEVVVEAEDLPKFVTDIPTPKDVGALASDALDRAIDELIGDLEAMRLVNLEAEGLEKYRAQLVAAGIIE